MIYTIKNEGESNEKMLLRYKKLFFQSRVGTKLKAERYVTKELTRRKRRMSAIVRNHYRDLNTKVYF